MPPAYHRLRNIRERRGVVQLHLSRKNRLPILVREIAASVPIHDLSTLEDYVGYAGERRFE
jgi:hypothetical protein